MIEVPVCKTCKSAVFTLAIPPATFKTGIYTGIKVLKCMVCGSYDEPIHVKAYQGEAELRSETKKRGSIVYRYESLIEEWRNEWNNKIGMYKKKYP